MPPMPYYAPNGYAYPPWLQGPNQGTAGFYGYGWGNAPQAPQAPEAVTAETQPRPVYDSIRNAMADSITNGTLFGSGQAEALPERQEFQGPVVYRGAGNPAQGVQQPYQQQMMQPGVTKPLGASQSTTVPPQQQGGFLQNMTQTFMQNRPVMGGILGRMAPRLFGGG